MFWLSNRAMLSTLPFPPRYGVLAGLASHWMPLSFLSLSAAARTVLLGTTFLTHSSISEYECVRVDVKSRFAKSINAN